MHPPFARLSFSFNAPATTELYPLSLHDALPIYASSMRLVLTRASGPPIGSKYSHVPSGDTSSWSTLTILSVVMPPHHARSEEHTSELQSRRDLVCRLLLEKKKRTTITCRSPR